VLLIKCNKKPYELARFLGVHGLLIKIRVSFFVQLCCVDQIDRPVDMSTEGPGGTAAAAAGGGSKKEESFPPGFRFHPTDEELITYYLKQKLADGSFTARAIAEVDLNKCEPWDLPGNNEVIELSACIYISTIPHAHAYHTLPKTELH
jgi:hypothetical protein